MSMKEDQNILDTFFNIRQEDLLDEMDTDRAYLKSRLKQIRRQGINDTIDQLPEEYVTLKNELYQKIEELVGDYEIKMAYYNKKYYKQGFHDAVMLNCKCQEKE